MVILMLCTLNQNLKGVVVKVIYYPAVEGKQVKEVTSKYCSCFWLGLNTATVVVTAVIFEPVVNTCFFTHDSCCDGKEK